MYTAVYFYFIWLWSA